MLQTKKHLVIGLTVRNPEMLRLAVPPIARLGEKFVLIVHNANPTVRISVRHVRTLGYRGKLRIINNGNDANGLDAYMAIIDAAQKINGAQWIIFVDQDTILTDATIPNVGSDNFAVIKSAAIAGSRITDILRLMNCTEPVDADGTNIRIINPNTSINATPVRIGILAQIGTIIRQITDKIHELDDTVGEHVGADVVLWRYLNTYARHVNPAAAPIYMNQIACVRIACTGDMAVMQNTRRATAAAAKYDAAFAAPLRGDD